MEKFKLSSASLAKLEGVHPRLRQLVERAIEITTVDFKVIEGVRSKEQAWINWGKGRTPAECQAKGVPVKYAKPAEAKVTWVNNPLGTKHMIQADGFGHAVDLLPAPYDWKDLGPFDAVADAMTRAGVELGIRFRWGADWDADGKPRERGETDNPHFEI